jgi:hypothetical protein
MTPTDITPNQLLLTFEEIAAHSNYHPDAQGRLHLPNAQVTADSLAASALALLPPFNPARPRPVDLTLTGGGPIWAYLVIAHALHGRVRSLRYSAPTLESPIEIWDHS